MEPNITITRKQLNNKSRKGTYFYVKSPGVRGAYYKIDESVPVQVYAEYYEKRYVSNKSRVTFNQFKKKERKKIPYKKTVEKARKEKAPSTLLRRGVSRESINDVRKLPHKGMKKHAENLIGRLTKTKSDAKRLVQQENLNKLKTRLEYRMNVYDKDNVLIAQISAMGNKTPEQVRQDISEQMKTGIELRDFSPTVAESLRQKGYTYNHVQNGTVKRVQMDMILRKG